MEAVAPAAAWHETAGELVDDHDLAVLDHVFDVEPVVDVRAEALLHVVEQRHVGRIVEAARFEPMREQLFGLGHAGLGERDGLVLFVDGVVARCFEPITVFGLDLPLVHFAAL